VREEEATAGASDERKVEELDMELVVNHERIAWIRYTQVCNVPALVELAPGGVSVVERVQPL
jgi:hypothetical protein